MTNVARADEDASDLALIEQWRAGDERAATVLVERHAAPLARFAASLGAWEEADELVQDTFVRAFGSMDSFRHDASLRTWLFTILRRLTLDRRRAARREPAAVPLEDAALSTDHGALDVMLADEAGARVDEPTRPPRPLTRAAASRLPVRSPHDPLRSRR